MGNSFKASLFVLLGGLVFIQAPAVLANKATIEASLVTRSILQVSEIAQPEISAKSNKTDLGATVKFAVRGKKNTAVSLSFARTPSNNKVLVFDENGFLTFSVDKREAARTKKPVHVSVDYQ